MVQIVLVAHGYLAAEMKNSTEIFFGELPNLHAINFEASDGLESLSQKIYSKMKALNEPVLIFADLFGGTPYNAACSVLLNHPELDAEVVSGMSLPLVLEIAAGTDKKLKDISSSLPLLAEETVKVFDRNIQFDEKEEL
ncbi:PTS sugar transporter subunit IIA [Streptococcus orisasini]|uniref:PTS sugar transporter subunit IIA n=1 Tax=Streptococcus orisasini TaxID=1080071 RepID=UPI000710E215|nr:PTS sugar transporter subunit IIA [Streptococcus orisasini]